MSWEISGDLNTGLEIAVDTPKIKHGPNGRSWDFRCAREEREKGSTRERVRTPEMAQFRYGGGTTKPCQHTAEKKLETKKNMHTSRKYVRTRLRKV